VIYVCCKKEQIIFFSVCVDITSPDFIALLAAAKEILNEMEDDLAHIKNFLEIYSKR